MKKMLKQQVMAALAVTALLGAVCRPYRQQPLQAQVLPL